MGKIKILWGSVKNQNFMVKKTKSLIQGTVLRFSFIENNSMFFFFFRYKQRVTSLNIAHPCIPPCFWLLPQVFSAPIQALFYPPLLKNNLKKKKKFTVIVLKFSPPLGNFFWEGSDRLISQNQGQMSNILNFFHKAITK